MTGVTGQEKIWLGYSQLESISGSCCVQPLQMASDLFLFTNQFNNITLVHSHEKCIYFWSLFDVGDNGGLFTADSRSHGRRVDKGARLSELLVAMINVAPDGGKWS